MKRFANIFAAAAVLVLLGACSSTYEPTCRTHEHRHHNHGGCATTMDDTSSSMEQTNREFRSGLRK